MTSFAIPGPRGEATLSVIAEWIVKRGVLSLLLLIPAAAVLIGSLLHLIPLPAAAFGVFVSFGLFTAWVSYRTSASNDPDEPVHYLQRYALFALLPIATFGLVQIAAFFAADVVYWQLWYGFGSELTRESSAALWSLAAGMVVYFLVSMGLVISYYVLVPSLSLRHAVVFLGILAPALFLFLFSAFSVAGAQLGPAWYVTFWLAFGVGTITAWLMPKFWTWVWSVPRGRAFVAVLIATVLLTTAPFAFAIERATGWQSGEQGRVDHAAFERITVEPLGPLVFAGTSDQTARYTSALRFGPRSFTNAAGIVRYVDAGPVTVEARLIAAGDTVAWCTGYAGKLASPNSLRDPAAFRASARELDYADVPMSCAGTAAALPGLCGVEGLTVRWEAEATLVGDRNSAQRQFTGQTQTTLTFPAGSVCS